MKSCTNTDLGNLSFRPRNLMRSVVIAFVGLIFANLALPAQAQTEPETIENVMKTSGFMVEAETIGGLLFLPNEDGTYKVAVRLPQVSDREFCEQKQKIHTKTKEVVNSIGLCVFPSWKAPEGFESDLANGGMSFDMFVDAVNAGEEWLVSALLETHISEPITPVSFNSDTELNNQIREAELELWTKCWRLDGTSSSAIEPATRSDCRAVKSKMLDLDVAVAKAELELVKAELELAKAENDAATKRLDKAILGFESGLRR